jgi:hypothetical protein
LFILLTDFFELFDLCTEFDPSDSTNGDVGGCGVDGDGGRIFIGLDLIFKTIFFLFICFLNSTNKIMFTMISAIKVRTSFMINKAELTTNPVKL